MGWVSGHLLPTLPGSIRLTGHLGLHRHLHTPVGLITHYTPITSHGLYTGRAFLPHLHIRSHVACSYTLSHRVRPVRWVGGLPEPLGASMDFAHVKVNGT